MFSCQKLSSKHKRILWVHLLSGCGCSNRCARLRRLWECWWSYWQSADVCWTSDV